MLVDHEEVVGLVEHAQPLQIVVSRLVLRPVQHQLHVFRQLPVAHTPKLLFYLRGAEGYGQGSDLAKKNLLRIRMLKQKFSRKTNQCKAHFLSCIFSLFRLKIRCG